LGLVNLIVKKIGGVREVMGIGRGVSEYRVAKTFEVAMA